MAVALSVTITHDTLAEYVQIIKNGTLDAKVPVTPGAASITHTYSPVLPAGTVITAKAGNTSGESAESDPATWAGLIQIPAKPGVATFGVVTV